MKRLNVICALKCVLLFSASAVTALARPSAADSARPLGRHVTPSPASTVPSAGTIRVTTPVNAGQVHQYSLTRASRLRRHIASALVDI